MYESFYSLREKPFRIVPDPGVLYLSQKHQSALTYLEYGLMEDVGVILLTGEIGMGKTTLVRKIINTMCQGVPVSVVFNTNVLPNQLLSLILKGFDIESKERSKTERLELLYRFLIDRYAEGKKPLLIIDEAQNLSPKALEEVRMLSNLQSDDKILLQIMLVGQPELKKKLQSPELAQFAQRIAVNYHLSSFTREETDAYIKYRVEQAGRTEALFTPDAIDRIHEASGGVPRSINLISDFSLVYAFGEEENPVGLAAVDKVIAENFGIEAVKSNAGKDVLKDKVLSGENDIEKRIERLEKNMKTLSAQIDWYIRKAKDKAATAANSIILNLNNQLSAERQKNEQLRIKYERLLEQFKNTRHQNVELMPYGVVKREVVG